MKLYQIVKQYVDFKRSMGMHFGSQAVALKSFCRTLGPVDVAEVTQSSVLAFLGGSGPVTTSWHQKLSTLRGFYRFAIDRGHVASAPIPNTVPKFRGYARPYIYSSEELRRLLSVAQILDIRHKAMQGDLQTLTFRTLLLLLYGAGLRISEALSLSVDDVNLRECLLTIRNSKFFKSRLVPIGPKLTFVLQTYANERHRLPCCPLGTAAFFITRRGTALPRQTAERFFRIVRNHAGIRREDGAHFQPRLHDLRHTFAVHRLVAWYRQEADVQHLLPQLSTYLGHVDIVDTQHYLSMTPELLREANRRFQHYALSEVNHV